MPTERFGWHSLRPTRLDFYVLFEVLGPFLGWAIGFIFIFQMFQLLRLAEFFIVHGVSGAILTKMFLLLTLQFMPATLPVSFLIGVLVGFGRLSSDSELVAMKASGIGIMRLAAPIIVFALVVGASNVWLNMRWAPWAERESMNLVIRVSNTKAVSSIKEGTFTSGFFDLLIFADKVDPKTNGLRKVFIFDEREPKNPLTVVARSGEIIPVRTATELGAAAVLQLHQGSIHRNDTISNAYQKIDFKDYRLYLKVDEGSPNGSFKPNMLPQPELMDIIRKTTTATAEGREMRGEFWRRYSLAITPMLFVFLGIGFGTVRTRAVRASAALVAFITLLVYWTLLTFATMQVFRGTLPPVVAMQLPNFAVLLAAVFSFRRALW